MQCVTVCGQIRLQNMTDQFANTIIYLHAMMILYPLLARLSAISLPKPEFPPVTIAHAVCDVKLSLTILSKFASHLV